MAAKKNFYAVKNGRVPGIYTTWDECKTQVMGFSGAVYKGFATRQEAENFMKDEQINKEMRFGVIAYVDGSYHVGTGQYSYGAVIFDEGKTLCFKEKFDDKEMATMRNVAGELEGAKKAMRYCVEHNKENLVIYHDYEGIAKWCTGEWQTKKDGTKAYKAYYDSIKDKVNIVFMKVKGHSGDEYNDMADRLAKEALDLLQ